MGKTKGGREMNPTDAARKQARKREIARNKKERDLQRSTPKEVPEINRRLAELLDEEESEKAKGRQISKDLHIRRKVLQDAMKLAVAKEREANMKAVFGDEGVQTTPHGHGVPVRRPEDSVYYNPVTNPTGVPPPGKPQRYKDDVSLMDPSKADKIEARRARARAQAAAEAAANTDGPSTSSSVLPPPEGPPPGVLPPPAGPPPGFMGPPPARPAGVLPPPPGPPPGMMAVPMSVLPPPSGPPPGILPPPTVPPPGFAGNVPLRPTEAVVEGAATAVRTIPAQHDKKLTAMVPASVRAKRQKVKDTTRLQAVPNIDGNAGFGLAPQLGAGSRDTTETAFASFMDEISQL